MPHALAALAALLTLAACGADGPPQPPQTATPAPGITMSGTVTAGIARNGTN